MNATDQLKDAQANVLAGSAEAGACHADEVARHSALQFAMAFACDGRDADDVVSAAKCFLAFLTGKDGDA